MGCCSGGRACLSSVGSRGGDFSVAHQRCADAVDSAVGRFGLGGVSSGAGSVDRPGGPGASSIAECVRAAGECDVSGSRCDSSYLLGCGYADGQGPVSNGYRMELGKPATVVLAGAVGSPCLFA